MKTLILTMTLLLVSAFGYTHQRNSNTPTSELKSTQTERTVLICTGNYSKKYHSSNCRGMRACKGSKKTVTISEAKRLGRTPCGICYR